MQRLTVQQEQPDTGGAPESAVGHSAPASPQARPYGGFLAALRAVTRGVLLVALTGVMLVLWGFAALPRRNPAEVRRRVSRHWARGCCRILGARVNLSGSLPAAPALVVSNHLSYLDILVLMSIAPCRFVAKREVGGWPLIGFLARRAGTLFVVRGEGKEAGTVLEGMGRALEEGDVVVFFPEGTTSSGERVLPFKSGLLARAARDGLPVWPIALSHAAHDRRLDAGLVLCWSGQQSLVTHLWRVAGLPGFEARVVAGDVPVTLPDRKALAQALECHVTALYERIARGRRHAGIGAGDE
jgi:1-acyl-sn-glycerol-3-phosphate acyltransferase